MLHLERKKKEIIEASLFLCFLLFILLLHYPLERGGSLGSAEVPRMLL